MPSLKFRNPETGEFEKLRGQKSGMLPSVYDPQGKQTDIFQYVDEKAGSGGSNLAVGPDEPEDANIWIDTSNSGESGIVTSFNGRVGDVAPQAGDYTAEMIGADSVGSAAQALTDAKEYVNQAMSVSLDNVPQVQDIVPLPLQNIQCRGVTYGNPNGVDVFVAVSYYDTADTAMYSLDKGITWSTTPLPQTSGNYKSWIGVAYGNGVFVATCRSSQTGAYSYDGINWHAMQLPSAADWGNVIYSNGVFLAIPYGSDNVTYAYSTNGHEWVTKSFPSRGYWSVVASGNGMFMVHDISGKLTYVSTDGVNWLSRTAPSAAGMTFLFYAGGYFFGMSSASQIVSYTEDGTTWHTTTLPVAASYGKVLYGHNRWVILVQTDGVILSSTDLSTWEQTRLGKQVGLYSGDFGAGRFVALPVSSAVSSAVSDDGITWDNIVPKISTVSKGNVADEIAASIRSLFGFTEMACGTYEGWGTTGSRYIVMTCPFKPKAVFVWANNGSISYVNGSTKYYYHAFATESKPMEPTAGTPLVYINGVDILGNSGTYGSNYYMLNDSGVTYSYIIWG